MEIINKMIAFFKALIKDNDYGYDLAVPLFRKFTEEATFEDVKRVLDRFIAEPEKVREIIETKVPAKAIVGSPWTVSFTSNDADRKISAIKELRAKTGLGIKESKDLIENGEEKTVVFIFLADAIEFAKEMESAGCNVYHTNFEMVRTIAA